MSEQNSSQGLADLSPVPNARARVIDHRFQNGKPLAYMLRTGDPLPFKGSERYLQIQDEKKKQAQSHLLATQKSGAIALLCAATVIPLYIQLRRLHNNRKEIYE
ncbi:MAG: hypothetical protein HY735_18325 [Verrucomicrobia bacterium]|nr:hypothetical protein [Verrucomicrobiota bacterium]